MAVEYSNFVEHPRYGQRPRITGLNPKADYEKGVYIHWHSPNKCRIPNTAVIADLSRQTEATFPVTHYFDVVRKCIGCGRSFIFFAVEQKYWYEELGFGLDSDCVRCVNCRKTEQNIARKRDRYQELYHAPNRTIDEDIEMADCCLSLMESGTFHKRKNEKVRMLLKRISSARSKNIQGRVNKLWERLLSFEANNHG